MYCVEVKTALDSPEAGLYRGTSIEKAREVFAQAIPTSESVVLKVWLIEKRPGKPDRGHWATAELFRRYRKISTCAPTAIVG